MGVFGVPPKTAGKMPTLPGNITPITVSLVISFVVNPISQSALHQSLGLTQHRWRFTQGSMKTLPLWLGLSLCAVNLHAADWLHYRGAAQNGSSSETVAFPAAGPKELWRIQLGIGLSSMTIQGNRLFTAGFKDGKEVLYCIDTTSGKIVWSHEWTAILGDNLFEGGPRVTPTIDGKHVYMVGNEGVVICVDAETGKPVWEKHLVKDFGGKRPEWGFSGAPTIHGNHLLLDCGGASSNLALNKLTGELVWKSGTDQAGYAPVITAEFGGETVALFFKAKTVVGCDAATGQQLWSHPFETNYDVNAAAPLVVGSQVLISAGYNHGSILLDLGKNPPEQLWFKKDLKAHFNSPVYLGGNVYGIDGNASPKSPLVCVDWKTGDLKWRTKEVQGGSLILAKDKLLILTETGDLVLAETTPESYKEIARKNVLTGRCWVQPTLSNSVIYCRNNLGELVAIELATK